MYIYSITYTYTYTYYILHNWGHILIAIWWTPGFRAPHGFSGRVPWVPRSLSRDTCLGRLHMVQVQPETMTDAKRIRPPSLDLVRKKSSEMPGNKNPTFSDTIWLVVGPPLWKIWKSIGMIIPNIWENKKCSKPPTSFLTPSMCNESMGTAITESLLSSLSSRLRTRSR